MPSFEFVCSWFKKAAQKAKQVGKKDSALLWEDGLAQLEAMNKELAEKDRQIARLTARVEKLDRSLIEIARINRDTPTEIGLPLEKILQEIGVGGYAEPATLEETAP